MEVSGPSGYDDRGQLQVVSSEEVGVYGRAM